MYGSENHCDVIRQQKNGYVLVVVLMVIFVGVVLIILATTLIMSTSRKQLIIEQQTKLRYKTDSAVENAILMLMRKPSYLGETITLDGVDVQVRVATGSPILIDAIATSESQVQETHAVLNRINGVLVIERWSHQ